jgi:tight adherence protein C
MLLALGFFASVLLAVFLAGMLFLRFRPAVEGPRTGETPSGHPEEGRETGPSAQTMATQLLFLVGQSLPIPKREAETLRKQLFRAGYRGPAALPIFFGLRAVLAGGLGILLWSAVGVSKADILSGFVPAVCGIGFGYLLPARALEHSVRARAKRIRRALPAVIDLLTLAIEAGQSLDSAMLDTSRALMKVYPDLCAELTFCHLEMRAGKTRFDALEHLGQRSGEPELAKLAALLIDGERFGTSLGPALRTHARYLRANMRFAAQESARKLTVKLVIPVFFLIFPSVLLVTLGPAYLKMREFFDNFLK